jgi:hypothetical protein
MQKKEKHFWAVPVVQWLVYKPGIQDVLGSITVITTILKKNENLPV